VGIRAEFLSDFVYLLGYRIHLSLSPVRGPKTEGHF